MYRYIFVLEDEFLRMQRAFQSRSLGNKKGWFLTRSFANMVGVLFIRAYERAERIYLAMCARGYNENESN
jgi:cobalt/nickel transport system permease protein